MAEDLAKAADRIETLVACLLACCDQAHVEAESAGVDRNLVQFIINVQDNLRRLTMAQNDLLVGWKQIARFLGVSERSVRGRKAALLEEGDIFYRRTRFGKRNVCAWQEDIRQWAKRQK